MYIVTSRNHNGSEMTIWHYKNKELAEKDYKELKANKNYKRVHLSKVIK